MRLARLAQDALEHRRDADEERHRTTFVGVEGHLCVKLGEEDLRRRFADRSAQEKGQPKRMEVGEQREERLRALVELPHPEHALIDVDADIAVREGSGLGNAVGTRSVQDDGALTHRRQRMGRRNRS